VSNRGRASRKAAEKAWGKELAIAERRGAKRVRDRLLAMREEHGHVVSGIEYVEWSLVATVLEEEVTPIADPTARPPADEEGPAPSPTST
jgi:hypothetical protein